MCAAFAKPEVHLGSLTPTGELGDAFVLVADVSRVVKVVQGTQGTVGERTWLRVRGGQACLLPCNSRVRVSCCGLNVEFYLQQAAKRVEQVVLRETAPRRLECDIGGLLRYGFVLQLRLLKDTAGASAYALDAAAITLPCPRPPCLPQVSSRTTSSLEAALSAQRRRCEELANLHAELMRQLPVLDDSSQLEKLRCRLGEVGRLLRQARLAEADMKQDALARRQWDRYDTGEETRDVLENGVRRAHMEARLGREVTREDVEISMQVPFAERARLFGLDPSRPDTQQLRRLPFAPGPPL